MRKFSVVALLMLGCSAQAQDDRRLLEAIGQVEGVRDSIGDRGKSLGRYQMQPAAWADANAKLKSEGRRTYPRSSWREATAQDMIAAAYLRVIRERLANDGNPTPSVEIVALCWNRGFAGARAIGFAPNGYAYRVGNLFRLQDKPIKAK